MSINTIRSKLAGPIHIYDFLSLESNDFIGGEYKVNDSHLTLGVFAMFPNLAASEETITCKQIIKNVNEIISCTREFYWGKGAHGDRVIGAVSFKWFFGRYLLT